VRHRPLKHLGSAIGHAQIHIAYPHTRCSFYEAPYR
jgi:hypothetical protein